MLMESYDVISLLASSNVLLFLRVLLSNLPIQGHALNIPGSRSKRSVYSAMTCTRRNEDQSHCVIYALIGIVFQPDLPVGYDQEEHISRHPFLYYRHD